jgi:organic hydroperoxide reductase OsmC/OhrA
MAKTHHFAARTVWTGAELGPTDTYEGYSREYTIEVEGKPRLSGSADAAFLGDSSLHNPEDLLVASLSGCHLLSYLACCARAGIAVVSYADDASGIMEIKDRKLRFSEVTLHPRVTIARGSDIDKARALHADAHDVCFIANSVNFPVRHEAKVEEAG